jgi:catechol 2,3-dioxygenase-like lactoylglutathione lyase family enzyme
MRVELILSVSDVERAVKFYRTLGLKLGPRVPSTMWAELWCGDAFLGLHRAEEISAHNSERLNLCFATDEALETIVQRLEHAQISLEREIADESFGRSIRVCDPDGLLVQINQHSAGLRA